MNKVQAFFLTIAISVLLVGGCSGKKEPPPHTHSYPVELGESQISKIDALKRIIKRDPGNLRAHVMLGNIYFDSGKNEEAVKEYRLALAIDPKNPDLRTDMGICLRRLGRTDEALEAFKEATRNNPTHYQSRYNLGLTLLNDKNDLQGALATWEELLRTVPVFPGKERLAKQVEILKETNKRPAGRGFDNLDGRRKR